MHIVVAEGEINDQQTGVTGIRDVSEATADSSRFSRANRIEIPSSSICLTVCKAGAGATFFQAWAALSQKLGDMTPTFKGKGGQGHTIWG